jgi:hypothetical protein
MTVNNKIIAVVIAVIVVAAGVGIFLFNSNMNTDKEINVVARVNTEGSGIYLKNGEIAGDYLEVMTPEAYEVYKTTMPETDKALVNDTSVVVFHTEAWEKQIFGTPGTTTIQHMQLKELVEEVMDLKFTLFRDGMQLQDGYVYFDSGIQSYSVFKGKATYLTGAFIWQAQYTVAVSDGCVGLIMTDVLFPEHTCCVLAASHKYAVANEASTVAFLAAYIKSVDAVNKILSEGSGEAYDGLILLTINKLGLEDNEKNRKIASDALNTINYVYADKDSANPLGHLTSDIRDLVDKYEATGQLNRTLAELGFKDSDQFANKFVEDKYIVAAIGGSATVQKDVKINVAAIKGDVHQIAIHYGIQQGYFAEYGISIEISLQDNGPGVATALENGAANFGLLGAPPLTIRAIDSQLVRA